MLLILGDVAGVAGVAGVRGGGGDVSGTMGGRGGSACDRPVHQLQEEGEVQLISRSPRLDASTSVFCQNQTNNCRDH